MSTDRDTTHVIRSWLREDAHESADRVLDAVLDQLPVTRQRRRWSWPLAMSSHLAPIGLASAAMIAVALLGLGILTNGNIGGPDPSVQASPTPGANAELSYWSGLDLPTGEYVIDEPFPLRMWITVPEGWESFGVSEHLAGICSNECQLPERAGLAFWIVTNVYADPCDPAAVADPPIGPTVDDLVAALVDLPRHDATVPTEVTITGYRGTYLELAADDELGECDPGGLRAWVAGPDHRASPPGDRDRLWILDVDGTRLMIDLASPPDAPAEELAELEAVVDSIRFEPAGE